MTRELCLSRAGRVAWGVVRHDGRSVELHAEHLGAQPAVGRVVKARVTRVVPSIQAAFVDLGDGETGFVPAERIPVAGPARPIQQRLREGSELLVQIARESPAPKAHRATARLTVPGRRLVLRAAEAQHAVSRRIREPGERERLGRLLAELTTGAGAFIARTAAAGSASTALREEADVLRGRLAEMLSAAERAAAPARIAEAPRMVERLMLDAPADGWDSVAADSDEDEAAVRTSIHRFPGLARAVRRHPGPGTLHDDLGLGLEIDRALRPRVWLRSGGRVTIEQTEALVAIDVDSGRAIRGDDPRATTLSTNLEAADEIARQLRLRGIGGIVVIDFIDMADDGDREQVAAALSSALEHDPARTKLAPPGAFGLMQLTRRRTRADLSTMMTSVCRVCGGRGRLRRREIVAAAALAEWLRRDGAARGLPIRLAPRVAQAVPGDWPAAARDSIAIDVALAEDEWVVGGVERTP